MSACGRSDHVTLLRHAIARIEAGARPPASSRATLGSGLDAALGGGLARDALHEIAPARPGDGAAACGFALALAARLAGARGSVIWILEDFAMLEGGAPYGPGLAALGIDPARLVLVRAPRPQDALQALEEALKSRAGVAVGEIFRPLDLAASRRLALAARAGGVPGLLLGSAAAAQTRLEIAGAASAREASAGDRLPIPGPAAFAVRILKCRGGAAPDRDRRHLVSFDPEQGGFRDAHPLPAPAPPAHRPADARARA